MDVHDADALAINHFIGMYYYLQRESGKKNPPLKLTSYQQIVIIIMIILFIIVTVGIRPIGWPSRLAALGL